jgi:hypothetical protein
MYNVKGSPPETLSEPPINRNTELTDIQWLRFELANEGKEIMRSNVTIDPLTHDVYMNRVKKHLMADKEVHSTSELDDMWWDSKIPDIIQSASDFFKSVELNFKWWLKNYNNIFLVTKDNVCDMYTKGKVSSATNKFSQNITPPDIKQR